MLVQPAADDTDDASCSACSVRGSETGTDNHLLPSEAAIPRMVPVATHSGAASSSSSTDSLLTPALSPSSFPTHSPPAYSLSSRGPALSPSTQLIHIERDALFVNLATLSFEPSLLSPEFPHFELTFNDLAGSGARPGFFLRVARLTGQGALWTVYEADLLALNVPPSAACAPSLLARVMHRVVIKVTRCGASAEEYLWCENSALSEADLFAGPLLAAGLVGTVVPTFYGMWKAALPRSPDHLLVAVYERVGDAIAEEWSFLHPYWVSRIQSLYRTLHSAGVLHGDIQTRHIRRRLNSDTICLIDFDHGYEADGEEQKELETGILMRLLGRAKPESEDEVETATNGEHEHDVEDQGPDSW